MDMIGQLRLPVCLLPRKEFSAPGTRLVEYQSRYGYGVQAFEAPRPLLDNHLAG